jgi:hypothetical protein
MRINRGFLSWGVFLLFVGAVPLAVRAGYLTEEQLPDVGSLWPLILVGIGIAILLARTRYAFLGGVLVAGVFGVIVGAVLSGGAGIDACGPRAGTAAFEARQGPLTEASASVDLDFNCGTLDLTVAPGNAWRIEGEDRDGVGPNLNADNDSLTIRSRDNGRDFLEGLGDRQTWRVVLPDAVPLDLKTDLNAGSSTMRFGSATLDGFELDLNAGSATIDLGSVRELGSLDISINAASLELTLPNQSLQGTIEANAGSVNLCVPPGAALRLDTSESIVSSYGYDGQGLVKSGSTWETPGFSTAAVRIELDTRANAGSFALNPEEGCGG